MSLTLLSFLAGILTVLAPCAITLLPIILGKSAVSSSKWRPYIIIASLAISLGLFTLLLKVSTIFLNIDPVFLTYFSGFLIIALGLISIFPGVWDKIQIALGLSKNSDELLEKAKNKSGLIGDILTGASLGPVFSSCSPTYAFVLSTTLQGSLVDGLINIGAYILGLSLIMLAVSLLGQRFVKKVRWMTNPNSWFKKAIGIIFIIVGITIVTGLDKRILVAYVALDPFKTIELEQRLIKDSGGTNKNIGISNAEGFNVNPPKAAPEIREIDKWINSNPLTLASLKGKVVLVDFWTYSCINCKRTQPYLNQWYDTYKDEGFTILGLHAPEFAFEQKVENVQKAVNEAKIKYPVGLDNGYKTWDAFNNRSWPSKYLIDAEGNIRYVHEGEGEYELTEKLIRNLIEQKDGKTLNKSMVSDQIKDADGAISGQTEETYLGWGRALKFANNSELNEGPYFDKTHNFTMQPIESDNWGITGSWIVNNEDIISDSNNSKLKLKFNAKNVYIVAGSAVPQTIKIEYIKDGKVLDSKGLKGSDIDANNQFIIGEDKLYTLVQADSFQKDVELELTVPAGVRLNVFTFGGE